MLDCVEFLLDAQEHEPDAGPSAQPRSDPREWPYEGVYREAGRIPLGYRVGGTAIVAWALVESPRRDDPRVRAAIERACDFLLGALREPAMASGFRGRYDVRGWGHTYALHFFLRARARHAIPGRHHEAVQSAVRDLIRILEETAIPGAGGWNYSRSGGQQGPSPASPFMTAPTLQTLFLARAQGEKVADDVITNALATLTGARLDSGAYQYALRPAQRTGQGYEAVPGAIGRMPVCETTLLVAGRGDVQRVQAALDAFFEHWQWLEQRRKQTGTHVPPYFIAPYYFYFAHYYAAQAIELLPEAERAAYRARLRERLFQVREPDGSWNDRVFPRSASFGTALALLTLLAPESEAPPGLHRPRATL